MKMVKSLLLGSAAGMVAVTMGQAADLPVKAKPVEYVKVCSLYGAGFYYMPGTDMCLKIGGWVRAEIGYGNVNGSPTWGPFAGVSNQRTTSNAVGRARGYITADAREQTAYGTARGYIAVGLNTSDLGLNTAANQFSANRAFVQWAGFTGGLAQSFYDFYSVPATSYWGAFPASDTGDPGWLVFAYTAQLGNGLSATISEEARRVTQLIAEGAQGLAGGGTITPGSYPGAMTYTAPGGSTALAAPTGIIGGSAVGAQSLAPGDGAYGGQQMGDLVGNLRVDQAWGSAQVMAALHEVNPGYYSTGGNTSTTVIGPALLNSGPSTAWGWAAGAGFKILTPMISQGDYIQTQFNVARGASRYIFNTPNTNYGAVNGNSEAFGVLTDGVYGGVGSTGTGVNLTSAWGFNAAYEHFWVPNFRTSLYGGYDQITYNSQANAILCTVGGAGSGVGNTAVANAGCNMDWSTYFVGSRTQWDVNKNFYLGVDVLYEHLKSANTGSTTNGIASFGITSGGATFQEANSNAWLFRFRAHKDFLP